MLISQSEASIRRFASMISGPTTSEEIIEEMVIAAKVFLKNFYIQDMPYFNNNIFLCKAFQIKECLKLVKHCLFLLMPQDGPQVYIKSKWEKSHARFLFPNYHQALLSDSGMPPFI